MDTRVKNRLVGAAVVIALGVVFVPVLMEPEGRGKLDRTSQIPPAPVYVPIEIKAPEKPQGVAAAKSPDEVYRLVPEEELESAEDSAPEAKAIEKAESVERADNVERTEVLEKSKQLSAVSTQEPAERPAPISYTDQGLPRGWLVQVASFSEEGRATAMRNQLLDAGYSAFTRSAKLSGTTLYRVFVGPKINRDRAQKLKKTLDKELSLNTMLVEFKP